MPVPFISFHVITWSCSVLSEILLLCLYSLMGVCFYALVLVWLSLISMSPDFWSCWGCSQAWASQIGLQSLADAAIFSCMHIAFCLLYSGLFWPIELCVD